MQIGTEGACHLTYCTNIHPGEHWEEVQANLEAYVPALKAALSPDRRFGIGLRLSDAAARELLDEGHLSSFKTWLDDRDLYVFTLNGFPYGGFHRQKVKDQVYAPDWRSRDRVNYTLRLARILAALLPDGVEGGISTSPISYKPWLDAAGRQDALLRGSLHLADVAAALVRIRERSGRLIHIDIEPEPDCLLENTEETVSFFQGCLLPRGGQHLAAELGVSQDEAEAMLREHIRVCYDTCHFAVEYEAPAWTLDRFAEAGIRVGKVQVSAALQVPLPEGPADRSRIAARLEPFAESTYLHQVVERRDGGDLFHYPDLGQVLGRLEDPEAREWRIHFHVPIFVNDYEGLQSTQGAIVETLRLVRERGFSDHLEIETYTWDVLPPGLKAPLGDSIRREFEWVLDTFNG